MHGVADLKAKMVIKKTKNTNLILKKEIKLKKMLAIYKWHSDSENTRKSVQG